MCRHTITGIHFIWSHTHTHTLSRVRLRDAVPRLWISAIYIRVQPFSKQTITLTSLVAGLFHLKESNHSWQTAIEQDISLFYLLDIIAGPALWPLLLHKAQDSISAPEETHKEKIFVKLHRSLFRLRVLKSESSESVGHEVWLTSVRLSPQLLFFSPSCCYMNQCWRVTKNILSSTVLYSSIFLSFIIFSTSATLAKVTNY